MEIKEIAEEIHENFKKKGFWDDTRPIPETLMLITTEVSEAMAAFRAKDQDNFREELADIVIRVFDAAEGYGIDIENEIIKKHEFNKSRPHKHGGKV